LNNIQLKGGKSAIVNSYDVVVEGRLEAVVSEIIELVGETHRPVGLEAGLIDEVSELLPEGVIEGEI
jgi:hypothetical protein